MKKITNIDDVKSFWNDYPCGSDTSDNQQKKQYYHEIEQYRYSKIRSIPEMAEFDEFKNKKVLEIGCGIGTDGRQFALNGAIYTGINLDEGSTAYATEAFSIFGHSGIILTMNAENLGFDNNIFDHIYSHGVIHHSPNTQQIVNEMYRVLKPGGTLTVMIYNKSSVNYYFEIMFLRKLFRQLLYYSKSPKIISKLTGFDHKKLQRHRAILINENMTHEKWVSINTDGPDCPLAKVYNKKQANDLFVGSGFINIIQNVRYFNKSHYSLLGKLIPNSIANLIGKLGGWHRWINAIKP